jgi:hypothetical protein
MLYKAGKILLIILFFVSKMYSQCDSIISTNKYSTWDFELNTLKNGDKELSIKLNISDHWDKEIDFVYDILIDLKGYQIKSKDSLLNGISSYFCSSNTVLIRKERTITEKSFILKAIPKSKLYKINCLGVSYINGNLNNSKCNCILNYSKEFSICIKDPGVKTINIRNPIWENHLEKMKYKKPMLKCSEN